VKRNATQAGNSRGRHAHDMNLSRSYAVRYNYCHDLTDVAHCVGRRRYWLSYAAGFLLDTIQLIAETFFQDRVSWLVLNKLKPNATKTEHKHTKTHKTRITRTAHISAKARLTSVAMRNPHQNLIICSVAHCPPSLTISCKSVRKFLRKVPNSQDRQTDKQTTTIFLGGGNEHNQA